MDRFQSRARQQAVFSIFQQTFRRYAVWVLMLALTGRLSAAVVTGQVQLVASRDAAVRRNGDYSGVAIWLEPEKRSDAALPKTHAVMLQQHKTFSPHILIVSQGSTVDFPNLDPIFHNAFSNFEGQIFDVALYPPGSSRTVRFDRPGIARVFCNIHPSMSAVIIVVRSRYYALTDKHGAFRIPDVAPGTYNVRLFHERATPETLDKLERTIEVSEGENQLAVLSISESGYLPVAHQNKYGRPYHEPPDEQHPYAN